MNHLNSIILEGNLTKPPVLTETEKGVKVSTISIAAIRFVKADGKIEEEVCYFDIEAYGKLAESLSDKGDAGWGVRVVGRLKQVIATDSDGIQRPKVIIEAEHIEFKPHQPETK